MEEKFKRGPVGMVPGFPSGPIGMPKFLIMWFAYCLLVGLFVAYVTGRTVSRDAGFSVVFHIAGMAAFLAYGLWALGHRIWQRQPRRMRLKETLDGLRYSALTARSIGLP